MSHPFKIPGIIISVTVQAILRIFMHVVMIILWQYMCYQNNSKKDCIDSTIIYGFL